jgi:hypothetical protein
MYQGEHPEKTLNTVLLELFEKEQYLEFDNMLGLKFNVKLEKQQSLPEFVILYNKTQQEIPNLLKRIQLRKDNKTFKYVLRTAVLIYESEDGKNAHAIAGLFCDDEYYVFDSNNILLRLDWTNPDHSEYTKISNNEYGENYFYHRAAYAIYVKED